MHNRKLLGIIQERDLERDKRQLKELHGRISVVVGDLLRDRVGSDYFSLGARSTKIMFGGASFLYEFVSNPEMMKSGAGAAGTTLAKNAIGKTGKAVLKEVAEEVGETVAKKLWKN